MKKIFSLLLTVLIAGIANAQDWNEMAKIVSSDRAMDDEFGYSSDISGNYAIIGTVRESEDENGLNTVTDAGSVYIFEKDGSGNWLEKQKLVAPDRQNGDWFGFDVAISGNYAFVGARNQDLNVPGGNYLGDGGAAYIFERDSAGTWLFAQKVIASDRDVNDWFGYAVTAEGNEFLVSAPKESDQGAVYVFKRDISGNWNQTQKLVATTRVNGDYFGRDLSISGNYAIFGSSSERAYLFEKDGAGTWSQADIVTDIIPGSSDYFGLSVSLSGNYAAVGAWGERRDTSQSNSLYRAGAAYIFKRDGAGSWNLSQKLVPSIRFEEMLFGFSISISGNKVLVGAIGDDFEASDTLVFRSGAGAAYLFEQDSTGAWSQQQKLVASDRWTADRFGDNLVLSGGDIIISAPREDEDAAGGNLMANAGSIYSYRNFSCSDSVYIVTHDTIPFCSGSTFRGETIVADTTFRDIAFDAQGCDSAYIDTFLVVSENPVILSSTQDKAILEDSSTFFSVTADYATHYQWQVDTGSGFNNITDGGPYSGATTSKLDISNATLSMNGNFYRCVVSGVCPGTTSTPSSLTVKTIVDPPANVMESDWMQHNVKVSPNPFTHQLNVLVDSKVIENLTIRITDITGKVMYQHDGYRTNHPIVIGGELGGGMYLLQLTHGEQSHLLKVVKK